MTEPERELRHLLIRGAHLEAERQQARARGDWPAVAGLELEIAALWREYTALEQQAGRVA